MAKFLIERGSKKDMKDKHNNTPLKLAETKGDSRHHPAPSPHSPMPPCLPALCSPLHIPSPPPFSGNVAIITMLGGDPKSLKGAAE